MLPLWLMVPVSVVLVATFLAILAATGWLISRFVEREAKIRHPIIRHSYTIIGALLIVTMAIYAVVGLGGILVMLEKRFGVPEHAASECRCPEAPE